MHLTITDIKFYWE